MTKLWGGRFEDEPAPEIVAFTESLSFDRALAVEDCAVLAAHARALARAGLLEDAEAEAVGGALAEIGPAVASGEIAGSPGDEDVHAVVEGALLDRLPDLGAKVRAGLSRNDRVVTALRLWVREHGDAVVGALCDLATALAARAAEHRDVLLPGYTHLQRAQPVTLGHHLLAHAFSFARDAARFRDALARADSSPLGSGALAGSTLGLDAEAAARDLGLAGIVPNSLDAVAARDFVAEVLAAAAIAGVHASRLGEEIVLWTTEEFGFAELSDAHATGSSLMPHKKNPDVAELARGKAGRLIGNLTALLTALKGLPLAYNRDLQEDKEPLFDSIRTLRAMLPALRVAIEGIRFAEDTMAEAGGSNMLLATDAAEALARAGVPFREAHEQVGKAVRRALETGSSAADHLALPAGAPRTARASVAARPSPGPAPASIEQQLRILGETLARLRRS